MLCKPRNQHTNWIFFFPVFQLRKKKTECVYQHHSQKKKIACYSNQEINMQNGLFSSFPAQKNSMHIPTSFSQKKLHVIRTKKSTCKLDFFSQFSISKKRKRKRKKTCIYQHHSHKKLHVIQTKKLTCKLDFFFQFSSSEKQHAYANIILIKKKLHVIQTKKLTCKLDFEWPLKKSNRSRRTLPWSSDQPLLDMDSPC